jgi:transcriptional regulator with XRE-family HTH domain
MEPLQAIYRQRVERLQQCMASAGLSNRELGRRAGLSDRTVGALKRGEWPPSVETVAKLEAVIAALPATDGQRAA